MLVGISGKLGSGKDEIARMIMEYFIRRDYHYDSQQLALLQPEGRERLSGIRIKKYADKLKDILCILTGCTRRQLEDPAFKNTYLPGEWNRWIVERNDNIFPPGTKASKWYATQDEAEACKMDLVRLNKGMDVYIVVERQITYRIALQEIGTDLFRDKFHPRTWINATFSDWKMIPAESRHWYGHSITMQDPKPSRYPNWFITDVRFPDEVLGIRERGGIVIRINRDDHLRDAEAFAALAHATGLGGHLRPQALGSAMYEAAMRLSQPHYSETALDGYEGFDEIVDNNGTLEDLGKATIDIVNKFKLEI